MSRGISKYRTAREMSGYTQEQAAELAFTSVSTIKRIESGKQPCTADMAAAMAALYKAPWVADPSVPNDYNPLPMTEAAMRFFKENNDVIKLRDRMTEIFADGVITKEEIADFEIVRKEIKEAGVAGRDLMYAG